MNIKSSIIIGAIFASLTLGGCAQEKLAEPTPSASPKLELSKAQILANFKVIAHASCDKALQSGVVEESVADSGFTLVMVPKDESYKDFSAAYFEKPDNYELIWESDAFSACSASMQFDLAEEAGTQVDMEVELGSRDGTFETTQDFGEYGISHLEYVHSDGLFTGITTLSAETPDVRIIRYGVTEEDRKILVQAVDEFLSDQ